MHDYVEQAAHRNIERNERDKEHYGPKIANNYKVNSNRLCQFFTLLSLE